MPIERFGDYALALMDLGTTVCRPRNPSCEICPCSSWDGPGSWLACSDHGRKSVDGELLHTFTQFHLQLKVNVADIEDTANVGNCVFIDTSEFDPRSLPNLLPKVYKKVLPYFEPNAARTVGESEKNNV